MDNTRTWNVLSITLFLWFAYHLSAAQNVGTHDEGSDNGSNVPDNDSSVAFEHSKIWSEILEELTIKSVRIYQNFMNNCDFSLCNSSLSLFFLVIFSPLKST